MKISRTAQVGSGVITLLLTLLPVAPALAEGIGSTTPPRGSALERLKQIASTTTERRAEVKDRAASSSEVRREEMRKRAILQITRLAKIMVERHQAAIDRLTKLVERISSRMDKLKTAGADTTAAEGKKTIALQEITQAQTLLNNAKNSFTLALTASTTKENMKISHDLLASTTDAIKDAHRAVVDLLTTVEKLVKTTNATSSSSN